MPSRNTAKKSDVVVSTSPTRYLIKKSGRMSMGTPCDRCSEDAVCTVRWSNSEKTVISVLCESCAESQEADAIESERMPL
jgi:hypothetical protein